MYRKRIIRQAIIPVGPSIAYIPLTQGLFALVDAADARFLGQWNWFANLNKKTGQYYAWRRVCTPEKTFTLPMHSAIMSPPKGYEIDHKYPAQTLDNRKCNLRYATRSQNACNNRRRGGISGIKGVRPMGVSGKWRARCTVKGKYEELGVFETKEQALAAYAEAAARMHGKFANVPEYVPK